jgi:hypothetical protein
MYDKMTEKRGKGTTETGLRVPHLSCSSADWIESTSSLLFKCRRNKMEINGSTPDRVTKQRTMNNTMNK